MLILLIANFISWHLAGEWAAATIAFVGLLSAMLMRTKLEMAQTAARAKLSDDR